MRILFLVPKYLDLYVPIYKELEKQGHHVEIVFDVPHSIDPFLRCRGYKTITQFVKLCLFMLLKIGKEYWRKRIIDNNILNCRYDLLLCINGCSFDPYLLNHLRIRNENIKSILYLWDTTKYYNYTRNAKYFDKVFSFDWLDCRKFNLNYLPFYWIDNESDKNDIKYKMSIIGTNHDGRLNIVERIAEQLNELNHKYYFNIYMPQRTLSVREKFRYWLAILINDETKIHQLNIIKGVEKSDFIVHDAIPIYRANEIISQSEIILDTDRETQTGITPRLMWALAKGKKIVTTNKDLVDLSFFDPQTIHIIDRKEPYIDPRFLANETKGKECPKELRQYRIDKWVRFLTETSNETV